MINIKIQIIPGTVIYSCNFDNNKSFGELKEKLKEGHELDKENYNFIVNGHIINDNVILKDMRITKDCNLSALRSDYINIIINNIKEENSKVLKQIINFHSPSSVFKVLKPNENKEVNV